RRKEKYQKKLKTINTLKLLTMKKYILKIAKTFGAPIRRTASQPVHPATANGFPAANPSSGNDTLQVSQQDSILTMVLNRPQVLNAIDMDMAKALAQHLEAAATDTTIRAIIITGAGRAFCAGGD